jgi:putative NADH-flavin reductase
MFDMSDDNLKFVRVTRTCTVTLLVPADSYQHGSKAGGGQMTDDEIRSYEMEKSSEDHAEALMEMMSVAAETNMDHGVKVEFMDLAQKDADKLGAV